MNFIFSNYFFTDIAGVFYTSTDKSSTCMFLNTSLIIYVCVVLGPNLLHTLYTIVPHTSFVAVVFIDEHALTRYVEQGLFSSGPTLGGYSL